MVGVLSARFSTRKNQPISSVNVTVNDISDTRKTLLVTVSGEEISTHEAEVLKEYTKSARVPGFRAGKAPVHVIRQRYRKNLQEALNQKVAQKVYEEAVNNSGLQVYSVVEFNNNVDYKAGEEVTVDLTVDVTPAFDLPDYKGIAVTPPSTEVEDKEIDEAIERLRRERADFKEVDRAAAEGDYVKVSYKGTIDGKSLAEEFGEERAHEMRAYASADNTWEEVGSEEAKEYGIPSLIDALVGHSKGAQFEVSHTYADDFRLEALRGRTVNYSVEVSEVRERILPEIDEEFLKALRMETLEELKGRILDDLEARKKQEAENAKRQQIIQFLSNSVEFPLPESAVEGETQNVMGRIMVENMQRGVAEEEFEKHKTQLHAQSAEIAKRDVKTQIILAKVAKEQEIKVEEQDLQSAVVNAAQRARTPVEEFVRDLQKDRSKVLRLQKQVLLGKTLDFLVKEANVQDGAAQPAQ